ncbi:MULTISPECIES: helix-turn-helix domain-containing protein [unclassified Microbacterium]|uniref:AraC-like ligand-binding domain-containing protein n=1 Tax=unclassified Microbacterium TaxID=2609290 RepID=UPI0009F91F0F|nr:MULTISPECIES: helix-turn-helix domain-containing protein [unclassified Microbacterium]MDI9892846.1 helix-turn-helix domain-containing protein [Microbacterium sp. IEGM 1404]MXS74607.1 helix-turn-helix domain-containing protein [Microbacterium sp. TL13]
MSADAVEPDSPLSPASGRTLVECSRSSLAPTSPTSAFDLWTDAVSRSFVPLRAHAAGPEERARFEGRLIAQPLGPTFTSTVSGRAVRVSRGRGEIARDDPGHIKLGLQLHGRSTISQDGRDAVLTPGDFALYDTTRPYALDFGSTFRMFVVMFPVEALRFDRGHLGSVTASRFSGRDGLGGIVSTFLHSLSEALDRDALSNRLPLADAVFDLLTAALGERLDLAHGTPEDVRRRAMFLRIESFIADHLGDPDLTVASIATAHHISVRALQKLFEERDATVSGWIRRARLDAIRRDLGNPALAQKPIASIGARWGFADAAAFARSFRQEFGSTPSDYRSQSTRAS